MNRLCCVFLTAALGLSTSALLADSFGSGANSFDVEFVTIGNPGNPPDANPNPAGAVPYSYRIGKYEISEQMIDKANAESALAGNPLNITKDTRGPDYPATSVTWYEAAKFVNWLNTSTGSVPAYQFDGSGDFQLWTPSDAGYDPNNLYRNSLAKYFLPSLNEWHKAAYYDPMAGVYHQYPTGSDAVPDGIDFVGDPMFEAVFDGGYNQGAPNIITNVGVAGPYGTFGQGGNAFEWNETAGDRDNDSGGEHRTIFGGSWATFVNVLEAGYTGGGIAPTFEANSLGLRVVEIVPEPRSFFLVAAAIAGLVASRMRRRIVA
jgi:formylglycine-generating enzyme required for sulfatase activity